MTCDECGEEKETTHRQIRFEEGPPAHADLCGPCERKLRGVEDVVSITHYPIGASDDT